MRPDAGGPRPPTSVQLRMPAFDFAQTGNFTAAHLDRVTCIRMGPVVLTGTATAIVAITILFAVVAGLLALADIHARDYLAPKE